MLGICSLFVPASAPRMINASFCSQADSLIFDLEDAVHLEQKDSARMLLSQALPLFAGKNLAIRINGSDGCWREDLELLRLGVVKNIIVPKATSEHLHRIAAVLDELHAEVDVAALIECTQSLAELDQIAASPRVTGLLMGGEDYSLDLGVERTREGSEILYARMKIANTAAAYHLEALDTPFSDVTDQEGLLWDCRYAKGLGFTGKLCINPLQTASIQSVFRPNAQEVDWARRVLQAVRLPENSGKGAFSLDGKMVDLPVIRRAEKTLARAGVQEVE